MADIQDDIIEGDLSDIRNIDSWIRLNSYCCNKVKEYMCSLIDDQSETGIERINSIREMKCDELRQLLEMVNSKSPKANLEDMERHVSTIIDTWDECLASKDEGWINQMS